MGQTLTEKIFQKHALDIDPDQKIISGDSIWLQPEHILTHDNTSAIIPKFKNFKKHAIFNKHQPVIALDHNIQDTSNSNLLKYSKIKNFCKKNELNFFPAGRGIGHQIMIEEGFAFPGDLSVASDSHANMYGGIGCLGLPVVRTDAAGIWATGKFWFKIPKIINIILLKKPIASVTGKDIILSLISHIDREIVLNKCLEFSGNGIKNLSVDDRLTIANMSTEWGSLSALFPIDKITISWVKNRNSRIQKDKLFNLLKNFNNNKTAYFKKDNNPNFEKTIKVDLSTIKPSISESNRLDQLLDVNTENLKPIKIDKAFLLSCANSRASDLKKAANKLKGKSIASHVKLYVSPASKNVENELKESGHWKQLKKSGAQILPAGCGPCIGLGAGILKKGEVAISASNRNFPGRMGNINSKAYLSSPEIVAETAINGYINIPKNIHNPQIKISSFDSAKKIKKTINKSILDNKSGHLLLCSNDNITTDDIYPSKYTYDDTISFKKMGYYAMENYDPNFSKLCEVGDILLAGYNFGIGSSREQSITSLKSKGVILIIACSYSETFKRNAFNNGFSLIECPELFFYVNKSYNKKMKTLKTNMVLDIDFNNRLLKLENGKKFKFDSMKKIEQELVYYGGLNGYLNKKNDHAKI